MKIDRDLEMLVYGLYKTIDRYLNEDHDEIMKNLISSKLKYIVKYINQD